MSFQKLTQDQRDTWRGDAVTKEAIALIRSRAVPLAKSALASIREGNHNQAAVYAGAEEYLRQIADILEFE